MAKKKNYNINGNEYFRIRKKIGEDVNGKAIMKAFYGSGKLEAEEKYRLFMEEQHSAPNKNRMDAFGKLAKYYTYKVMLHEKLAPGTIELYERKYRENLAPAKMMIRPVKEISSGDIQSHLNNLAQGKLDGKQVKVTQASLENLCKYLKRLFRYLNTEGYCQNIMSNITIPKVTNTVASTKRDYDEIEVFSEAEIKSIIEAPNRKSFLWQLALSTGLRSGEILALKYDDIRDDSVTVNKQLNYHYKIDEDGYRERVGVIKSTKSSSSVRVIPIPQNVMQALKIHSAWHKEEMVQNGYRTDYIFTTDNGNLLDKGNFRVAWIRHLKRAGVSYRKFHCCRSTYCTILCKRGVSLETASKLMGHSDINVTAKFYRFVGQEEMQNASDRIDDLFSIEN